MKTRLLFLCTLFLSALSGISQGGGDGCIRLFALSPEADIITIQNLTSTTLDISDYRLCSLFSYTSGGIGENTTVVVGNASAIPAGQTVTVIWPLNDVAADLAIYVPTGSFGDPNNMVDFMQYGSAGNGRESEADQAGLWTAGEFVPTQEVMVWVGTCDDHSVANWLGTNIAEFDGPAFTVAPNPVQEMMNIQLNGVTPQGTVLSVYDLTGRRVERQALNAGMSGRLDFATGHWLPGYYLVEIAIGNEILHTTRIVKQ